MSSECRAIEPEEEEGGGSRVGGLPWLRALAAFPVRLRVIRGRPRPTGLDRIHGTESFAVHIVAPALPSALPSASIYSPTRLHTFTEPAQRVSIGRCGVATTRGLAVQACLTRSTKRTTAAAASANISAPTACAFRTSRSCRLVLHASVGPRLESDAGMMLWRAQNSDSSVDEEPCECERDDIIYVHGQRIIASGPLLVDAARWESINFHPDVCRWSQAQGKRGL